MSSYEEFEHSGFVYPFQLRIEKLKVFCSEFEFHRLCFSLLQKYLFESFQRLDRRCNGSYFIMYIQLHDLFSVPLTGVRYFCSNRQCLSGNKRLFVRAYFVGKRSVAESVSERI